MVKSMTGHGRSSAIINGKEISVEMRSVNHRYADFSIKIPKFCSFMEDKVREYISSKIKRGKVDIFITVHDKDTDDKIIVIRENVVQNYVNVLKSVKKKFGLSGKVSLETIISFADIFDVERKEVNEEELWNSVKVVLEVALNDFTEMRKREGERLKEDLSLKCNGILKTVDEIEQLAPNSVKEYRERITARIREILGSAEIDEGRILTEVGIYADKVAIDEETVRLKSHFAEMHNLLNSDEAVGRKLDFLLQEMNREVNTIGSKANDINITQKVVNIKSELEKVREQVQNIE